MSAVNPDPDQDSTALAGYGGGLPGVVGRSLETVVEWAGTVTLWITLAMVLVIATNVILRYFFAIGPVGMQELEWHLMAPVALIGSAYGMRHNSHVRVDMFYENFSPRTKAVVNLVSAIGLLIASLLIVWLSLSFVYQAYEIGESSPDPGGLPYRFVLKAMMPLGFALLALQALAHVILNVLRLRAE